MLLGLCALGLPLPLEAQPAAGDQARAHFQRGKAAFELGRFQEALEEYQAAYRISPLPGFLFNLGQCHRNLGQYKKAIFSFKLYLKKKPNAHNREAVELLLSELETKVEVRPPPTTVRVYVPREEDDHKQAITAPPPPPPKRRKPIYAKWWFWTGVAAVAAGSAVGIYFAARPRAPSIPDSDFEVLNFSR